MSVIDAPSAVNYRLQNFAELVALTGSRWFPDMIPQSTAKPCGYYEQTDSTDETDAMGTSEGVESTNFELTIVGDTKASCQSVMAKVKKAFRRWSATQDGFVVMDCFLEGTDTGYSNDSLEFIGAVRIKLMHQTT